MKTSAWFGAWAAAALALAGCNSFTVSSSSRFVDEDGNIISVTYGQFEKERDTVFTSPVDGRKIDMKSKLAVRVTLPDGGDFTAVQCMNMLPTGTMYMSSDAKWLYHANGTTCSVYLINETKNDYILVFDGALAGGMGSRRPGAAANPPAGAGDGAR